MSIRTPRWKALRTVAARAARWSPSPNVRRMILAVAAVVFLGATALAVARLPPFDLALRWLIVAAVLALGIPVLNALEYMLMGRWVEVDVGLRNALSVTVVASAANLAPLPGAALVRAKALLGRGTDAAETGRVLASLGVGWVGVAVFVAGTAVAAVGRLEVGTAVMALGIAGVAALPVMLPPASRTAGNVLRCVLLELVAVLLQALRLVLILVGLGYEGRIVQTLVLPAAGALGNAAGLVPGGLGLRELLAGAFAPLVDLPAAEGVVAAATDRVLSLLALAVAALLMALNRPDADSMSPGR